MKRHTEEQTEKRFEEIYGGRIYAKKIYREKTYKKGVYKKKIYKKRICEEYLKEHTVGYMKRQRRNIKKREIQGKNI